MRHTEDIMTTEPITIRVEPGSELDKLFEAASTGRVWIERRGILYQLVIKRIG